MYGLSILVLLPVIAQQRRRRRRKRAVLVQRQKVLKHYSLSITANNSNILSQMTETGSMNFKNIPTEVEFFSLQSIKTITKDIDENDRFTFSVPKWDTLTSRPVEDDDEFEVTADDCIVYLLNNTPWNTSLSKKAFKINFRRTNSSNLLEEQHIPMIKTSYDQETHRSISNSNVLCEQSWFNTNPTFIESRV
ncbi:unnamed protein product [Rotaria socialis]|uniref:Uncharacterized protein n=1 Tax=Rotaria socialis TaxID=392032 RepID=A0A818R7Q8_9BILA|nr:unnamed protein product [Rotaria socialis]CAF4660430.1 unnamed protein product [Rotaria socialis]